MQKTYDPDNGHTHKFQLASAAIQSETERCHQSSGKVQNSGVLSTLLYRENASAGEDGQNSIHNSYCCYS